MDIAAALPSPDLALIAEHAMQPRIAARVLERMGFERYAGPMPRGGVAGFDVGYARPDRDLREKVARRYGAAQAALFACHRRAEAAGFNRNLAAHAVLLLAGDSAPATAVWFDTVSGEWRDTSGGQAGQDILTLGAVMWQCRLGQAAWRCARIAGLPHGHR
jgi:hypothetical protein